MVLGIHHSLMLGRLITRTVLPVKTSKTLQAKRIFPVVPLHFTGFTLSVMFPLKDHERVLAGTSAILQGGFTIPVFLFASFRLPFLLAPLSEGGHL